MIPLAPEQWEILKDILDQAAGHSPNDRQAFLESRLVGDQELLKTAKILLQGQNNHGYTKGFDLRLQWHAFMEDPDDEGSRIGPYQLREKLGSGGMGVVYLAERDWNGSKQKVALKILKRGLDTEEIIRRFENERSILARLNNPYIVSFIDGGTTKDHLPYLVMTLVEGKSLFTYCREENLDLRQRLVLLSKICHGLHFAHQNLVIHRDLKPSNILITKEGEPRLLDFGIAKLLAPNDSEAPQPTQADQRLLTPDYASPEQFRGDCVTTASDIYSLGILSFELMAGVKPSHLSKSGLVASGGDQALKPWVKPSRRLKQAIHRKFANEPVLGDHFSANQLKPARQRVRRLQGDLDRMAFRAMHPDPGQRYDSAMQFASDIERYLENKPVLARGDAFGYVFSKWVKRHLVPVSFSLVVLILAGGFGLFSLVQQRHLMEQREIAEAEQYKSHQVSRFMAEVFAAAEPFEGDICEVTATMLVQQSARQLVENPYLTPKVKAELMGIIPKIYQEPGLLTDAHGLLLKSVERQMESGPPAMVAHIQHVFGHFHMKNGATDQAKSYFEQAKKFFAAQAKPAKDSLADLESSLGEISRLSRDHREAKTFQIKALALLESAGQATIGERAKVLRRLAAAHTRGGELLEAAEVYQRALFLLDQKAGYAIARAEMESELGVVYRKLGRLSEAEALFKRGLTRRSTVFGADSPWTANMHQELGWVWLDSGAFGFSEQAFEASYRIRKANLGPQHADVLQAQKNLAGTHLLTGKFQRAGELLDQPNMANLFDRKNPCDPRKLELLLFQIQADIGNKNLVQAENRLQDAFSIVAWHEAREIYVGFLHLYSGDLAFEKGQLTEATHDLQKALTYFDSQDRVSAHFTGRVHLKIASHFIQNQDFHAAEQHNDLALKIFSKQFQKNAPFIGECLKTRADIARAHKDHSSAKALYAEAHDLMVKGFGLTSPKTKMVQEAMNLCQVISPLL